MTRRNWIWLAVGVAFVVGNVAGAVFAAWAGELIHASVHGGLALLGSYPVWRLTRQLQAHRARRPVDAAPSAARSELTDRLKDLEQSVDAVALEVERIGEGQRFMTRVFTEKGAAQASGQEADLVKVKASDVGPA